MRIISGIYKGKNILGYEIDGTRPTQDRIKESLFSIIQERLRDATILDLFAGSGNLGLESLSNGANRAYFVDNNPHCIEIIQKNIDNLNIDSFQILKMDYQTALEHLKKLKVKFDIIFLDPPYSLICLDQILNNIIDHQLLNEDGIIVCEYENEQFKESYSGLTLWKQKEYGYKNIRIYEKEE